MARQLGLGVDQVIDPGHGGQVRSIGKSGLQEKEVNLAVALALRKLLRDAGIDAILTRESDVDVGLDDRTVIANQKRADLFVSIHANAHRDRKRGGVETFFLNISPDPSVIELAAAENATSTKNIGEMKSILEKIVQNNKIQESYDLASAIQKNLVKALARDLPAVQNLGVKGGPFWVLIGGEMPSVLVEVSHLSNAKEEARLKTAKYRDLAARGIYDGIMEYIHSLGKG
jgi:N-acetylmuramoyl-L-alanine amidase